MTCKRGSFLPGDVKCKHGYFIILWFASSGISARPLMKSAFVYAYIELKYGDISVERLTSNFEFIMFRDIVSLSAASQRPHSFPFELNRPVLFPFQILCYFYCYSWKQRTPLSSSQNMFREVN